MLALIPFLCFFLLLAVFTLAHSRNEADWGGAFCRAAITWAWLVLAITVALSVFRALAAPWLVGLWAAVCVGLSLVIVHFLRRSRDGGLKSRKGTDLREWGLVDLSLLLAVVTIVLLVGMVAWLAPTNDGDPLSYHLPRVAHWAQNRSVAPYATSNSRQIWMAPWPEYSSLHFYILSRGDHLANFTQFFSYVGAVLLAASLAHRMGADRRGQLLTAVFLATLPPMLSQASDANTDVVPVFWVLCAAGLVAGAQPRDQGFADWLWLGAALGIGGLAKGTFLAYAFPLVVWFGLRRSRRMPVTHLLARGLAMSGVMLLAWSANWIPNWLTFGTPFGSPEHVAMIGNASLSLRLTASNLVRSLAVIAAVPFDRWNEAISTAVSGVHKLIGLSPVDPANTFPNMGFGVGWLWPGNHSAPLHLGLSLAAALILLAAGDGRRSRPGLGLLGLSFAGMILFCAAFKFQPSMRFHLSLLALAAPVVGCVGSQWPLRRLSPWICLGLFAAALPVAVADRWRPLVRMPPLVYYESAFTAPRDDISLRPLEGELEAYHQAADAVLATGCKNVGLRIDSSDLEYPWWVLLDPVENGIRVEHVFAFPALERFSDPDFAPCAIICTICGEGWQPPVGLSGQDMGSGIRLYLP